MTDTTTHEDQGYCPKCEEWADLATYEDRQGDGYRGGNVTMLKDDQRCGCGEELVYGDDELSDYFKTHIKIQDVKVEQTWGPEVPGLGQFYLRTHLGDFNGGGYKGSLSITGMTLMVEIEDPEPERSFIIDTESIIRAICKRVDALGKGAAKEG